MRTSVSVVIPAYNAARFLDACLAHLAGSTDLPLECIVVDDGSSDDTAAVAHRHGASCSRPAAGAAPRSPQPWRAAGEGGRTLLH